ncbi:carboxypeptidase-like regulatory domain-containing protein [Caloranaerobacter ferrireducens]|uniref:carboxypeptidase-like regulatory domain-containing protein n=1 Tax=Caloranaerobacter ferrireducens TaxID=1323370 RepID=UPI00084D85D4|nr:carboxypeptidase-like regulatory domain-containing protein [Caloranaerobacter ferrireducens]
MSELYKLTQSQLGEIQDIGQEIRLDVQLDVNPYLDTGSITGTVTDPNGDPIEGALVKVLDKDHNPLYHTLTDAYGKYDISNIIPASELHVYAIKQGYLLAETQAIAIAAGQTVALDIVMQPDPDASNSAIAGHVVDIDDNPVSNLQATLIRMENDQEIVVVSTITNEYGQYAFVNLPIGNYFVRLSGLGYKTTDVEIQITQPGSITRLQTTIQIAPEQSKGTINGIIKDSQGNPIEGAVVILYEVTGDPENPTLIPIRYTKTIAGGVYLFGDVPQGKYIVKANKEQ